MDSLRITPMNADAHMTPCCRCDTGGRRWDRLAGKPYCPNCQEALVTGEADVLIERTERHRCAACSRVGTLRFLTFPLHASAPVELDLCPEHLRALLARRLRPRAFHQLRRQFQVLDLSVEEIFLLHGAFYDDQGQALHPAIEVE